jgi:hypothetical protein
VAVRRRFFPGLGKKVCAFSGAWKNNAELFQGLENQGPIFSKAWKKRPGRFPRLGTRAENFLAHINQMV